MSTLPTSRGRGRGAGAARQLRIRARRGEGGQTMPLVLGIILVLSLGTVVLVQNTFQQFPIVSHDVVQHEAYRAMQSGLDEYQYAVNANADFAACSARFYNPSTKTYSNSTLTSSSSVCSALSLGSWISVPGSGAANGPSAWFLIDNPVINTATGYLSVNIIGAAGRSSNYNYQTALVTMQPLNGFLLNVLWLNYDQTDPAVLTQYGGGTCTPAYFYTPNPNALGANCQNIDFVTADTLTGNLFMNDTVFVCGSPTFDNVETADPSEDWDEYGSGCSGSPTGDTTLSSGLTSGNAYTTLSVAAIAQAEAVGDTLTMGLGSTTQTVTVSTAASIGATTIHVSSFVANAAYASGTPVNDNATGTWTSGVPVEPVPTDNSVLDTDAASNGCVYQGPTTITLNGTANTMTVNSPGTPAGMPTGAPGTSVSNDPLNAAANTTNVCVPASWPGTVAIPADGVVYVEGCQTTPVNYVTTSGGTTKCNNQTYNPLSAAGETGSGSDITGDAIVQGTVNSPMTIGSANNIVIDGNICYADNVSGGTCTALPSAPSTDVLGLVADNYVEINHPVTSDGHGGYNNVSSCSATLGSGLPTCDLQNPYIDAVILALNHSFLVNNYNSGSTLGTLNIYGTVDQDWRGPVGTFNSISTTLTSALASGSTYTSLKVQALSQAANAGDVFTIGTGSTVENVTLSAGAANGATTLSVTSFTANAAYATGTQVNGTTISSGYAKNYQYDPRLVYLSPPYYLNPGTSQWGFSAFTVDAGVCQLATGSPNTSDCTTFP